MKTHNSLTDDAGVEWEFLYDENYHYATEPDGETLRRDEGGRPVSLPSTIEDFRYRRKDDGEWLLLPSWADVGEDWKINLCFFDEDEETGEMTFWQVAS